jgi:hypothetical protein
MISAFPVRAALVQIIVCGGLSARFQYLHLPREVIINAITGLAYSLEEVGKTESLKINIEAR